jgi:hypothetical protein
MLVASIVVETLPGKARIVAEHMGRIRGVASPAADGDHRVTATWTIPETDKLEGLCEVLRAMNPEIVDVRYQL